ILNTAVIGAGAIHGCHINALRQIPGVGLGGLVPILSGKSLNSAKRQHSGIYNHYPANMQE
ncbi:Gfo/Idh/MocA family protein, partial [Enterobacter sichuanensis]